MITAKKDREEQTSYRYFEFMTSVGAVPVTEFAMGTIYCNIITLERGGRAMSSLRSSRRPARPLASPGLFQLLDASLCGSNLN